MMKLTVTIDCDGAAFVDRTGEECAFMLRSLIRKLEDGWLNGSLLDTNGNSVGYFTLGEVEVPA